MCAGRNLDGHQHFRLGLAVGRLGFVFDLGLGEQTLERLWCVEDGSDDVPVCPLEAGNARTGAVCNRKRVVQQREGLARLGLCWHKLVEADAEALVEIGPRNTKGGDPELDVSKQIKRWARAVNDRVLRQRELRLLLALDNNCKLIL